MKSQVLTKEIYSPEYLFNLDPFFQNNTLDLINQNFFPHSSSIRDKNAYASVKFPHICNTFLENEIKGFVQHLALDLKYTAATLKQYITQSLHAVSSFMNSNHPTCDSIVDIDFEVLYNEYIEYLTDNGQQIVSNCIHRVNSKMEIVNYPCKTHYLSGFVKFYKYIYSIRYPDLIPEYDKDKWDIRQLGIQYSTAVSRKRYTINFSPIQQEWLKNIIKQYIYYRLQTKTVASVLDDMKALRIFSEFLSSKSTYNDISSLDSIERNDIEEFFKHLHNKNFVTTTYNHRLSALRTFFQVSNMLDIPGVPAKPLILYSDYRKIVHKLPKYFTDNELKQMNAHINDLPVQIGRMFFILENCGMRVSDICSSTILINGKHCLEKNSKGEYIFTYYMPKTHKFNTIPVSEIVGNVIEEAIKESIRMYGKESKYIFSASADHPISVETFSIQMNNMSAKNKLVRDNGEPLRIKGHTFRGTVATQYANCGISMDVIRMMLGQEKIGVLKHYVTIHSDTMINYMKPIMDQCDKMIRSINNPEIVQNTDILNEPSLIPLPNGRCSKDISTGVCSHAFSCYKCKMFVPSIEYIDIYKKQLRDAENNIAIAELHGYDRIKDLNITIRNNVKKIIDELEN